MTVLPMYHMFQAVDCGLTIIKVNMKETNLLENTKVKVVLLHHVQELFMNIMVEKNASHNLMI